MRKTARMRLLIVLAILMSTTLACNLPSLSGPSIPPTPQPVSTEALPGLEQQIQETLASPDVNGNVSLTLTQPQINAILISQLAQQPDQVISNPSVVLTTGGMEVYGKVSQSGFSTNVKIILQPAVDANGEAKLNVTSIDLGGIPIPDVLKNQIESTADNALKNASIGSTAGLKLTNIRIEAGEMTLTGTRQP